MEVDRSVKASVTKTTPAGFINVYYDIYDIITTFTQIRVSSLATQHGKMHETSGHICSLGAHSLIHKTSRHFTTEPSP